MEFAFSVEAVRLQKVVASRLDAFSVDDEQVYRELAEAN